MTWLKWLGVAALIFISAAGVGAWSIGYFASDPVYSTENGAIDGYDPVAYFTQSSAVPGRADITAHWRGAEWHFTSVEHRDQFLADPEKFAPAFGGYCAYAMGNAYTAHGDPKVFSMVDGRLFLNFDVPTQEEWTIQQAPLIAAADKNWPSSRPGQAISRP